MWIDPQLQLVVQFREHIISWMKDFARRYRLVEGINRPSSQHPEKHFLRITSYRCNTRTFFILLVQSSDFWKMPRK